MSRLNQLPCLVPDAVAWPPASSACMCSTMRDKAPEMDCHSHHGRRDCRCIRAGNASTRPVLCCLRAGSFFSLESTPASSNRLFSRGLISLPSCRAVALWPVGLFSATSTSTSSLPLPRAPSEPLKPKFAQLSVRMRRFSLWSFLYPLWRQRAFERGGAEMDAETPSFQQPL